MELPEPAKARVIGRLDDGSRNLLWNLETHPLQVVGYVVEDLQTYQIKLLDRRVMPALLRGSRQRFANTYIFQREERWERQQVEE